MPKRILVADDSPLIRKQIRTILELDPYLEVCAEAENGLEAVRKVRECRPDLAVVDFQMPVMNGLEATRPIKKQLPATPILLFTVYSSPEFDRESKRAGADAVLSKAEGGAGLSRVVHSLLRED
jgi:DNA-binding NarL/FixJ family response regulator